MALPIDTFRNTLEQRTDGPGGPHIAFTGTSGGGSREPQLGQWEGQDIPLVRPPSCIVKGGIPTSRRYLPTYLPTVALDVSCSPFTNDRHTSQLQWSWLQSFFRAALPLYFW